MCAAVSFAGCSAVNISTGRRVVLSVGAAFRAVNAGMSLLHVEVAAAGSLFALSQLVPPESRGPENSDFRRVFQHKRPKRLMRQID